MKKALALVLALVLALSLVACGKPAETTPPAGGGDEGKTVFTVCNIVNGNLGDKSFFDSCEAGLAQLKADGIIEYTTMQLGAADSDMPMWESTLDDVSSSGEYDYIIVGTWQMTDILAAAAAKYPDQNYIFYDNAIDGVPNICNIGYAQNQMGYLVGVYAALMTSQTDIEGINAEKVVGFVGGTDSPVINDFLYGFLEGIAATDPEVKVDTRYVGNFYDTATGKELALAMVNDKKADIVWGVAGGAGNGGVESAVETGTWFLGVDSDQELTFPEAQAARTLGSGLKNIDKSMVWFFTELAAGRSHIGETVSLDLTTDGVGIALEGNAKKYAPQEVLDAVEAARQGIMDGSIKVSTAVGDETNAVAALRDSMKP